ncbi:phosphatidylserine/phosphatidylglycerophosphate/cardiolipin synthase-like enzyme [Saccharopolyspora erythraea NRRL 2338]|uniref:Phospholipase D-like domain-containing protein n=1 Tax=Saccharopolyspora erythraea TaxID=1836 RepID=A0ABN1D0L0_SACER|nr:phospholipase D family protein [Saccharopolyspora erythraea]EQD81937.1 phospholipase [Saccharopolyspora erythraea D]PFG97196.1 phosphatidylserine/phosphatidylglycerophosphate/cardiolipin synthase-like enzyme [Saccharopolyspora erythraea NRRL 2338]QRK87397.1 phospholipase [Saccharopolyspora erythraea]
MINFARGVIGAAGASPAPLYLRDVWARRKAVITREDDVRDAAGRRARPWRGSGDGEVGCQVEHVEDGGLAGKWLLSSEERGNPATDLDLRHADGAAWSRGNLVRPLIDGVDYFRRLRDELADVGEGDQIYISAWIGDPAERLDGSGKSVGGLLVRALEAGAAVHGLFWCPYVDARKDFVPENDSFVALLQSLGGEAVFDQRVRAVGCHHQKFIVIRRPRQPDSDVAFVGGLDPCASRRDDAEHHGDPQAQASIADVFGDQPAWHDAHLQVRGPAVADVEHCFRERWNDSAALRRKPLLWLYERIRGARSETVELPPQQPPPPRCGGHVVQLLRTYPSKLPPYPFAPHGERSVARGYRKALGNARRFVYVEDQFLWSPMVAEVFAEALRREPELHLVAVLPEGPDKDGVVQVATSDVAHREALDELYAAGGDRVQVYELENTEGLPVYVHSKVCVVDDEWAAVGSANLNRRSWTYDSELTAAVVDEDTGDTRSFAAELRLRLWREHLGRGEDDDEDLVDPLRGMEVLRRASEALEDWRNSARTEPRPRGHLRIHPRPAPSVARKAWARPTARAVIDPDGRSRAMRRQNRL